VYGRWRLSSVSVNSNSNGCRRDTDDAGVVVESDEMVTLTPGLKRNVTLRGRHTNIHPGTNEVCVDRAGTACDLRLCRLSLVGVGVGVELVEVTQ
jgi:hypothetical protein